MTKKLQVPKKSKSGYDKTLKDVIDLLELARHKSAQAINSILTSTYWEIGRKIVTLEQRGLKNRKHYYGEQLIEKLSEDLTTKFGRGFGRRNLYQMRAFYLIFPQKIMQTPSAQSHQSPFPLPWSHYVKLLSLENEKARDFYHKEAIRGGWSFRQLDRQISTLFYERTISSRKKKEALIKGSIPRKEDLLLIEEEVKDPYILEFL
jgi:hypothetical protein